MDRAGRQQAVTQERERRADAIDSAYREHDLTRKLREFLCYLTLPLGHHHDVNGFCGCGHRVAA